MPLEILILSFCLAYALSCDIRFVSPYDEAQEKGADYLRVSSYKYGTDRDCASTGTYTFTLN